MILGDHRYIPVIFAFTVYRLVGEKGITKSSSSSNPEYVDVVNLTVCGSTDERSRPRDPGSITKFGVDLTFIYSTHSILLVGREYSLT